MKVEIVDSGAFSVFINRLYAKNCDFSSKETIVSFIKVFMNKLKNRLHLRGFYKVKVFVHEKIGLFLDIIRLDDIEFSNVLDLRIIVYFDENIFFEVDDYFIIEDFPNIRYFDDKFYCLIDKNCDQLYKIIEFGRFVYGDEAFKLLNKGIIL